MDDGLRRRDVAQPEGAGIAPLTLGHIGAGERIPPAQRIPVIDMHRQRQDVLAGRQFAEVLIRRRAGIAGLGGKHFDHHQMFSASAVAGGIRRPGGNEGGRQKCGATGKP